MIALFEQCARAAYPLRFYITSHFGKCAAVVPLRFSLCRPPLRALRVSKKDVMQSTQPSGGGGRAGHALRSFRFAPRTPRACPARPPLFLCHLRLVSALRAWALRAWWRSALSQCASRMSRAALSQCASRLVALRACRAPRSVSALRAWGASRLFSPPARPWAWRSAPTACAAW